MLGSLLNPANTHAAKIVQWEVLSEALSNAISREKTAEEYEAGVVAQGLSKASALLTRQYSWVVTNVPYLVRGKQGDILRNFCEKYYPRAKHDIATVFLERCLEFCMAHGTISIVLPQNWLLLTTYSKFRERLLKNNIWHLVARLGPGAFETISGEVVKAILITFSKTSQTSGEHDLLGKKIKDNKIAGIDVSELSSPADKSSELAAGKLRQASQANQLENPGYIIRIEGNKVGKILNSEADCFLGICTGDMPRFAICFWEQNPIENGWNYFRSTALTSTHWGGMEKVLLWENDLVVMVLVHGYVERAVGIMLVLL